MENRGSLVVDCGVVWYDHNISWSSSTYKPLASSNFFLSPLKITLFTDLAFLFAWGCTMVRNLVCTPNPYRSQWSWCWQIRFHSPRQWRRVGHIDTWSSTSRSVWLFPRDFFHCLCVYPFSEVLWKLCSSEDKCWTKCLGQQLRLVNDKLQLLWTDVRHSVQNILNQKQKPVCKQNMTY